MKIKIQLKNIDLNNSHLISVPTYSRINMQCRRVVTKDKYNVHTIYAAANNNIILRLHYFFSFLSLQFTSSCITRYIRVNTLPAHTLSFVINHMMQIQTFVS